MNNNYGQWIGMEKDLLVIEPHTRHFIFLSVIFYNFFIFHNILQLFLRIEARLNYAKSKNLMNCLTYSVNKMSSIQILARGTNTVIHFLLKIVNKIKLHSLEKENVCL